MKIILSLIISGALVVSGYSQTRNVLVGTNNAVVQPANFWSADASNARTGLGLGTAATNPASVFQSASLALSNLASSNGGSLTNIRATNLVGIIPASNIATVNFSNLAGTLSITSGGTGATNAANARQNFGSTTVGDALFIATNAASARTTLGATTVGGSVFTAIDAAAARTALSLGTAATNPASAFQPSSTVLSNLASSNGAALTNIAASSITGTIAISNGGSGATTAGGARTNFGLGATWLTNTAASNFRTAIGLGASDVAFFGGLDVSGSGIEANGILLSGSNGVLAFEEESAKAQTRTNLGLGGTNNVVFNSLHAEADASSSVYSLTIGQTNTGFRGIGGGANDFVFTRSGTSLLGFTSGNLQSFVAHQFSAPLILNYGSGQTSVISFGGIDAATGAAISRTNLGLGWSALTNSNAGTGLVSVNTNGEVVSPTNFWQAAPITTTFIESQPNTNFTTNITPARFLHIHSLATNIVNVTNTVVLPTNTLTFEGDVAIVVHKGPTNSMTRVQRAGSTNNLITLTRFDEAVQFVYYNDVWQFDHNVAFVEPIYFSGTNTAANAAASRTNLGLGATNDVTLNSVAVGGFVDNPASAFIADSGGSEEVHYGAQGITYYSQYDIDAEINIWNKTFYSSVTTNPWTFYNPINFNNTTNAAATRTNLGLGATNTVTFAGLTNNGDITINQTTATNGLLYIRRTNNEPFLGLANLIASNNVTVSNETLFRVGVSEATNKAAQFGFRATNTNGNGVAVFSVFGYNALMMIGPSDPAAGTNPIQATVYSINPTNKVMTLVTTNTGATLFHRAIEFENTTNQAVTRTNIGLGGGITTNLDIKLNDNSGMRLYFHNGILTNAVTPIP